MDVNQAIAELLALAKKTSENYILHIEVKIGDDVYVYEDGERLLSNVDTH